MSMPDEGIHDRGEDVFGDRRDERPQRAREASASASRPTSVRVVAAELAGHGAGTADADGVRHRHEALPIQASTRSRASPSRQFDVASDFANSFCRWRRSNRNAFAETITGELTPELTIAPSHLDSSGPEPDLPGRDGAGDAEADRENSSIGGVDGMDKVLAIAIKTVRPRPTPSSTQAVRSRHGFCERPRKAGARTAS